MTDTSDREATLKAYSVWDRNTRCFHWVNFLCVLLLAILGIVILNAKTLGVDGEGKILLKELHTYVGYVFCINLIWRFIWAFVGNRYARWKAILPGGKGYLNELTNYIKGAFKRRAPSYVGHNPAGRLTIGILLLLLSTQAVTGLILAGTDLYKPPFGGFIAEWVTQGDPEKLSRLRPGSKASVDEAAYKEMRRYRKPVITLHLYCFYALMAMIVLHIAGVVITEIREKENLISALFSGTKILSKPPSDKLD